MILNAFRRHLGRYSLEPDGRWARLPDAEAEAPMRSCGYADERRVGIARPRSVFAAVYLHERSVWLRIGDRAVDLDDPAVHAARRKVWGPVKAFDLRRDGRPVFRFLYWWADGDGWPDEDVVDIFLHVPSMLGTPGDRRRFVTRWSLIRAGTPVLEAAQIADDEEAARGRG